MKKFIVSLLSIVFLCTLVGCGQSEKAKKAAEEAAAAEQAKLEEAQAAATAIYDDFLESSKRLLELVDKVVKKDQAGVQEFVMLNNKLKKLSVDLHKQTDFLTEQQNDSISFYSKELATARKTTNR